MDHSEMNAEQLQLLRRLVNDEIDRVEDYSGHMDKGDYDYIDLLESISAKLWLMVKKANEKDRNGSDYAVKGP